MKDNIERRTVYYFIYADGEYKRKPSRKAAVRKAEARQRNSENISSIEEPIGVVRARQEIDLNKSGAARMWGSKKKVGLNPEQFPKIVEHLKEEKRDLEETWSDHDVETTNYYIENEEGKEIPLEDY